MKYTFLLFLCICKWICKDIVAVPTPTSSFQIVVARYNEDISWLNPVQQHCIVYNKGKPLNISNEKFLPNVGRESETYLRYIIDNYDNLPEVVVFTQADIEDHKGSNDHTILLSLRNVR